MELEIDETRFRSSAGFFIKNHGVEISGQKGSNADFRAERRFYCLLYVC